MNLNFINPPAHVGEREIWELWGVGPTSYLATGDPLLVGGGQYVSCPASGFLSVSGNYLLRAQPNVVNSLRPSWVFRWLYSGVGGSQGVKGVVIATAGSGQTNGSYVIAGVGGGGTGASVTVTVAGGLVTNVVITAAGTGYTSAPTFTVAAGGTPGTLTATTGSNAGNEVPAGTNLSAEQVQFSAVGGQL
jgi:hypothetical protein